MPDESNLTNLMGKHPILKGYVGYHMRDCLDKAIQRAQSIEYVAGVLDDTGQYTVNMLRNYQRLQRDMSDIVAVMGKTTRDQRNDKILDLIAHAVQWYVDSCSSTN